MKHFYFVFFMLFTSAVAVQGEPFEFKGVVLGSDIAAIESDPRFSCRTASNDAERLLADKICELRHHETIAGAPIKSMVLLYYDGKLQNISVYFGEKYFSQVVGSLAEKYGQGNVTIERPQNRMGATIENKVYSWRRAGATLKARHYTDRLDTSSASYETDYRSQEYMKRRWNLQ